MPTELAPSGPTAVLIEMAETPAGIAVWQDNSYRFIAVESQFALLDGCRFWDIPQVENAMRALAQAQSVLPAGEDSSLKIFSIEATDPNWADYLKGPNA